MNFPGITDYNELKKLDDYAELIYSSNTHFNLTGFKQLEEIRRILIFESLVPFSAIDVPRGTSIADIGSGSGIPGIPLSIRFPEAAVTMFDATQKKIEFINSTISHLKISNAKGINCRVEDIGRDLIYRETFDWVMTRAMADPYTVIELGSPLVKKDGFMYMYVNESQDISSDKVITHINDLGMLLLNEEEKYKILNVQCGGILLKKRFNTNINFPRRINAIRRSAK